MDSFYANSQWPNFRADVLDVDNFVMANGGAIMSMPTSNYYSSLMPIETSNLLQNQLALTGAYRPRIATPVGNDPVAQGLASVRYYYRPSEEKTFSAFPMVREKPGKVESARGLPEVFKNRNDVIGDVVYSPASDVSIEPTARSDGELSEYDVRFTCPQGLQATLDFRKYRGSSQLEASKFQEQSASTELLNQSSAGKPQTVRLRPEDTGTLNIPIACTDLKKFTTLTTHTSIPAVKTSPGRISAKFNKPADIALVTTTAFANWKCSVNGREIKHSSYHGLLAVPMDGENNFDCSYHTSGLMPGAAISMSSVLAFILLGYVRRKKLKLSLPEAELQNIQSET